MTVIKKAFHEGRETTVDWTDSKAKQDAIKLDTFAANVDNFNGRAYLAPISLEQVCPKTGKVLQTFSSRLSAAKWIVTNVMKKDDPDGRKAISITGNMHMCMLAGFKSYGFYWRTINAVKHHEKLVAAAKKMGNRAIHVLDINTGVTKAMTFASMYNARGSLGVSDVTIKRVLGSKNPVHNGFVFTRYNLTPKVKRFKDVEEAAKFFHAPVNFIKTMMANKTPINNYTIEVEAAPKTVIRIMRDRKIQGEFATIIEAADSLGVTRHAVGRAIKANKKIGFDRVIKVAVL